MYTGFTESFIEEEVNPQIDVSGIRILMDEQEVKQKAGTAQMHRYL